MTTAGHAAERPPRDWKVTTGYRVLTKMGWASVSVALYGAAVALVVGIPEAWWLSAASAAFALLLAALVPAPVPRELITGGRNHIDSRRSAAEPSR